MSTTSSDTSHNPAAATEVGAFLPGRIGEFLLLSLVTVVVFFVGAGRHDFIKTEALRAIVVHEMLETDGYPMPNIHHRPYLKKPPLYAWATTALARCLDRFDEGVARLPSNLSVMGFILLLYVVGELAVGRYGGLAAAALGLVNVTTVDYGMRAELDMGFTFWTTLSMLLVWPTIRSSGVRTFFLWLAVYAAALIAALYKGPHSLIFLWLMLLGYSYGTKRIRWLFHPAQILGLACTLGVLIWWAVALAGHTSPGAVGRTAGIEFIERLIPLSPKDWISILTFVPALFVMLLPGSLLILCTVFYGRADAEAKPNLASSLRALLPESFTKSGLNGYVQAIRLGVPRWWRAMAADPFAEFLLCWLLPNIIFMAIVPAKSSRYTLPIFAPAFLLAAFVVRQSLIGKINADTVQRLTHSWRGIFGVIGIAGLVAAAMAVVVTVQPEIGGQRLTLTPAWAWGVLAIGWISAAAGGILGIHLHRRQAPWLALLVVVLAAKPAVIEIWWPQRVRSDTQKPIIAELEDVVPPGQPVIVLGKHELPDLAFYSLRPFYWVDDPTQATAITDADHAFVLIPAEDYDDRQAEYPGRFTRIKSFVRKDRHRPLELAGFQLKPKG